jgi:hypothetical protein
MRLDDDLLQAFKSKGRGWQTRINSALREWLNEQHESRRAWPLCKAGMMRPLELIGGRGSSKPEMARQPGVGIVDPAWNHLIFAPSIDELAPSGMGLIENLIDN